MTEHQIQLSSDGLWHHCILDGVDITDALTGVDITMCGGELPQVTLSPVVMDLAPMNCAHVQVEIAPEAAKLLESLGWTPPNINAE